MSAKKKAEGPQAKPIGRPTLLTPELAERIAERLTTEPAHRIFADADMPDAKTFYNWMRRDDDFFHNSARARAVKVFSDLERAEQEMEAANDQTNVALLREKLQHYRWLASKLLRTLFGDKVEHTGKDGGPIEMRSVVVIPDNERGDRSGQ